MSTSHVKIGILEKIAIAFNKATNTLEISGVKMREQEQEKPFTAKNTQEEFKMLSSTLKKGEAFMVEVDDSGNHRIATHCGGNVVLVQG